MKNLLKFTLWLSSLWLLSCKQSTNSQILESDIAQAKIALGKSLFFDKQLSRNYTMSCASCHKPALAFTDGLPKSIGVSGNSFLRNAPSLLNTAKQPYFFADGGVLLLHLQAIAPIEDKNELNFSMKQVAYRLQLDQKYQQAFWCVFKRAPDAYGITRALAAYQTSLHSTASKFDLQTKYRSKAIFSLEEAQGEALFYGKGKCASCHSGTYFSNFGFYKMHHSDTLDIGRQRISLQVDDRYAFKVPMLRNVALTAPYLHNGSVASLNELLENMALKGEHSLTLHEQKKLIVFLKTLSDTNLTRFNP